MNSSAASLDGETWYRRFHDLMPFRIREILLVSSPYDAFILEEDGRLTERIFTEYSELNLSVAPRITHASSPARAFELLKERRFDLVLTVMRLEGIEVENFGREIKKEFPTMPVVVLAFSERDLARMPEGRVTGAIDRLFLWNGDARILLAVIKLIEDAANVAHDTLVGEVRTIIVVEDSVRRYSSFLSLLYAELMAQSNSLIAEGVNDLHKLLRMRARPKVLLASTYEDAIAAFEKYADNVLALITDVRFPKNGVEDPKAGYALVEKIRSIEPNLAILIQSANAEAQATASNLGVLFVNKNSPLLLRRIRSFLVENLGFGEFIFRLPDYSEVSRARSMYEMEQALQTVPVSSIEFHATRNHFSLWLMARSMFSLAKLIRPRTIKEFGDGEGLRKHLVEVLRAARIQEQKGTITDFGSGPSDEESSFVRIGRGSLGGKSRGLAFANQMLVRNKVASRFSELDIRIPHSIAIGSEEFETFLEQNAFAEEIQSFTDDHLVLERFLSGHLPERLIRNLRLAVQKMHNPLAVRSSTLLEDSHNQPFAGIYATYMLPNNHINPEVRFQELCRAIKAVYASTYASEARGYMRNTPYSIEEERMGVLIQEVVGQRHGDRFYPFISGVARSYNAYPVGHQRAEQGIAMLALGLGQMVVSGGSVFRFAPGSSAVQPQFASARDVVRLSQTSFFALNLQRPTVNFFDRDHYSLGQYTLDDAEKDGTLSLVGSVYSPADEQIRDTLAVLGPRAVTFNNILKWNAIPLEPALSELLELFRSGMGCEIEIEFAVDEGDLGRTSPGRRPCFHLLQVRPQSMPSLDKEVEPGRYNIDDLLCHTDRALGHGVVDELTDVLLVTADTLDAAASHQAAEDIGRMNDSLLPDNRACVLIGPGRWGSSDPMLGIPVKWSQITQARVIIERNFNDRAVEPSQGSHFFHNLLAFHIGYLTLSSDQGLEGENSRFLDVEWLKKQPVVRATEYVTHIRLHSPMVVYLDGKKGRATMLKRKPV